MKRIEEVIKQKQFKSEYQKLVTNIFYTNSWLNLSLREVLKPYQLSMQQYNLLRILRGQHPKPVSVNLLIDRMLDKTSNASRLVEKLRLKDLVERKECGHDRRKVDILITQNGLDLLAELDQSITQFETKLMSLSEEEALLLNNLLDKLRD